MENAIASEIHLSQALFRCVLLQVHGVGGWGDPVDSGNLPNLLGGVRKSFKFPSSFVAAAHIKGYCMGLWGCFVQGVPESQQRSLRGSFWGAVRVTVFLKGDQHGG